MKTVGRKRRVSAEAERKLREWKPMRALARELGLAESTARQINRGYQFKQMAPEYQ